MTDAGEDIYKSFFHILPAMLATIGFDGLFTELNPGWEGHLGFTGAEMTGRPCLYFIHPEDLNLAGEKQKKVLEGEPHALFDARFRCKDGSYKWLAVRFAADRGQKLIYLAATDITARKLTETALKDSQGNLRRILEQTPMAIGIRSLNGDLRFINKRFEQTFGYTAEEIFTMRDWVEKAYPDLAYRKQARAQWDRSLESSMFSPDGEIPPGEYRITCKDGSVKLIHMYGTLTAEKDLLCAFEDITEGEARRKAAETSAGTLSKILDKAPMSMAIVALDGTIEYINHKAEETFGYPHSDIPNMDRWWALAYPDEKYRGEVIERWMGRVHKAIAANTEIDGGEFQVTCKDGTVKTCHIFGVIAAGKVFVMFDDITARATAEQALRESEKTLRRIIEKAPMPMGIHSRDGKVEYLNAKFTQVFGYTAGDVPDKETWALKVAPDPRYRAEMGARWSAALRKAAETGEEIAGEEYHLTCKDGTVKNVFIFGMIAAGKVFAMFDDITARLQAEQALRESEATLRRILDNAPMALGILGPEGRIEYLNSKFSQTFGYTLAELADFETWGRLASTDEKHREAMTAQWLDSVKKAAAGGGEIEARRYTSRCKDGTVKSVMIRGVIIGERIFIMFDDITDRVRAEQAVRDSERTLRSILELAPLAIAIQNPDRTLEFINHKFTEYFGYTKDDIPTLEHWARLAYPDEKYRKELLAWQPLQIDKAAKTGREMEEIVVKITCKGGAKKSVRVTGMVTPDQKVVSLLEDITARVETERALRESESRYRAMIETTGTGYVIINKEGRVLDANREYVRLTGRKDLKEVLGHSVLDWTAPYGKEKNAAAVARCAQDGYINNFEVGYAGPDGTIIPVEINATVTQRDGVPNILTLCRDISERSRNMRLLRESEDKFRTVTEKSMVGVYLIQDDKFVYVNPALAKTFGYTVEEIAGNKGPKDLTLAKDWPTVRENLRRRFSQETQSINYEFKAVRKDGAEIDVEVYGSLTDYAGKPAVIGTLMDVTARRLAREEIEKLNAGLEQRVRERTAELSAANEDLMQEISQRIQAEQEKDKLREELQQAQKMEAVGRLAGGIAHDFNNILVSISGYAEFLLKSLPAGSQGREDLSEILLETEKGASLTRQLLTFSRKQPAQPKVLNLNDAAVETQKMLKRLIGANMHLETKLEPGADRIMADPGQISQVIMNLVLNARDAMPEGGRITLETRNAEIGQEYLKMRLVPKPGHYVLLSVSDTGTGMTPETMLHIFEPFYTTKEPGKGTGLGLPTVYGIVSQAHGGIEVESEPGRGTTFKIYFPRTLAA